MTPTKLDNESVHSHLGIRQIVDGDERPAAVRKSLPGEIPKVAFYVRISTNTRHQKYSLEAQEQRLHSYCTSLYGSEWKLHAVYADAQSGASSDRPGLIKTMKDAHEGAFSQLMVFRVDRLSRNVTDLLDLIGQLTAYGVVFKSCTEPFDTSTASGRMLLQLLGVFAELERSNLWERRLASMQKIASEGGYIPCRSPFGYCLSGQHSLEPNPVEAAVVRRIYRLYTREWLSSIAIAKELNVSGVFRREGRPWSCDAVLLVLRGTSRIGKVTLQGRQYEGAHKAIVPRSWWREAKAIALRRHHLVGGEGRPDARFLLKGIMVCSGCGQYLGYCSRRERYVCESRSHITTVLSAASPSAVEMDEAVVLEVRSALLDKSLMMSVQDEAIGVCGDLSVAMKQEIAQLERKHAGVMASLASYDSHSEALHPEPSAVLERTRSLQKILDDLEGKIHSLQMTDHACKLSGRSRTGADEVVAIFDSVMNGRSVARKAQCCHLLIEKLVIHGNTQIDLWLRWPTIKAMRKLRRSGHLFEVLAVAASGGPNVSFCRSFCRLDRQYPATEEIQVRVSLGGMSACSSFPSRLDETTKLEKMMLEKKCFHMRKSTRS